MAAVHLVGAVCGEDERPRISQLARQVMEQVEARIIGPVEVLKDDEDWSIACERHKQAVKGHRESLLLVCGCVLRSRGTSELGKELREVGCGLGEEVAELIPPDAAESGAHRRNEWRVGERAIRLHRRTDEDTEATCSCARDRLAHERTLASSGLAADDDRLAVSAGGSSKRAFDLR